MEFKFSNKSKELLSTVDIRLQNLFNEVIKYYDCTIIEGIRTVERQRILFDTGKSKTMNSKHIKGLAVDVMLCPIDWDNKNGICEFAGCVKTIAKQMKIEVTWGGDWKGFVDMPHWEIE